MYSHRQMRHHMKRSIRKMCERLWALQTPRSIWTRLDMRFDSWASREWVTSQKRMQF